MTQARQVELGHRSVWSSVDRLIDSTGDLRALRANRLHLLAARRWRELGREIPPELEHAERLSALVALVAPHLMTRVRSVCDGPLLVHKGPEVAARYPDPALRPYVDLDVLVPDAASVQRALVAGGFVEVGDPAVYAASPHRLPLVLPGIPLLIEVHDDPNWPDWFGRPPTRELFAEAVPSSLGVKGIHTLASHHHALVVATHAWAHGPLARVGDLVDVAAMTDGLDRRELEVLAREWGIERLWRTTLGAVDSVLFGGARPLALRVWARNLPAVRERVVYEAHVGSWLKGFSALGLRGGVRMLGGEVLRDLRRGPDETWSAKLGRIQDALRRARVTKSRHDEELERTRDRR